MCNETSKKFQKMPTFGRLLLDSCERSQCIRFVCGVLSIEPLDGTMNNFRFVSFFLSTNVVNIVVSSWIVHSRLIFVPYNFQDGYGTLASTNISTDRHEGIAYERRKIWQLRNRRILNRSKWQLNSVEIIIYPLRSFLPRCGTAHVGHESYVMTHDILLGWPLHNRQESLYRRGHFMLRCN